MTSTSSSMTTSYAGASIPRSAVIVFAPRYARSKRSTRISPDSMPCSAVAIGRR